ncbi:hypothetical protein BsWGS_01085 [Bradybaena similaris]
MLISFSRYYLYSRTRFGYYYNKRSIKNAKEKYGDKEHSDLTQFDYGNVTILPIPMLNDNYAYLVSDTKNNKSVIIDPGNAEAVQKVLAQRNIRPEAILATHKHWDHVGGSKELRQLYPGIRVYGGEFDNVPDITHTLAEDDNLEFGDLKFQVIFTPGHTVGHIVYLLDGGTFGASDCLFSGDCLFLGGSGHLFEAPATAMVTSLDKLVKLKDSTLLWPGHDNAADNLDFSCHLEPENIVIQNKLMWAKERRANRLCSCPSTIGEEKTYNPFLRTSDESILRAIGMISSGELIQLSDESRARALNTVREHKDQFKYLT